MSLVRSRGISLGILGFVDMVQDREYLKINQHSGNTLPWLLKTPKLEP